MTENEKRSGSLKERSRLLQDKTIASRFQLANLDPTEVNNGKLSKKTYSLFNNDGLLINIERILIEAERAKSDGKEKSNLATFDRFKKIFLELLPQLADIKVEYFEKELTTAEK